MTTAKMTSAEISARVSALPCGEVPVRCPAFGRMSDYGVRLDADGTLRVYDSLAGYYSIHHGLTPRSEARVVRAIVAAIGGAS